ncbi:reverse transcriptase domain-containing protein [Tanacetum coccineum]
MPPKRNNMSAAAIDQLIAQRMADALVEYEANQNSGNGNGSHDSGTRNRRTLHTICECTYKELLNCQPLNFKGTEGAVGLFYWFEKMESVFHISNCTVECQVKYATCTLLGGALTWWNSHIRTVGHDVAYRMPWKTLMKMMTETYCLRSEIKKLKSELTVPDEADKVERYAGGILDNIQGSVMASKPKMLQEAIELARSLMDQKVHAYNVARPYTAKASEKKEYAGTLPLCNKFKLHRNGSCTIKCENCKKVGHMTRDCRSPVVANNQRTLTFFECGNQGHYKSDYPKLKNQGLGNQAGSSEARGRVYALGGGETDQDPNNIKHDIDA